MTRSLILLSLLTLSGCAGLSVNFDAAMTYRSAVPAGGRSDTPAEVAPPPPIAPGKAS